MSGHQNDETNNIIQLNNFSGHSNDDIPSFSDALQEYNPFDIDNFELLQSSKLDRSLLSRSSYESRSTNHCSIWTDLEQQQNEMGELSTTIDGSEYIFKDTNSNSDFAVLVKYSEENQGSFKLQDVEESQLPFAHANNDTKPTPNTTDSTEYAFDSCSNEILQDILEYVLDNAEDLSAMTGAAGAGITPPFSTSQSFERKRKSEDRESMSISFITTGASGDLAEVAPAAAAFSNERAGSIGSDGSTATTTNPSDDDYSYGEAYGEVPLSMPVPAPPLSVSAPKPLVTESMSDALHEGCCCFQATKKRAKAILKELDEVSKFPAKLFTAFNEGDMVALGKLIDVYCTRDCTYRTTSSEKAFCGRDFAKSLFIALTTMYPDMVFLMNKSAKLVELADGGGAVVMKVCWTGTREKMQPSIIEELYMKNGGSVFPDELFRDAKLTEADKQRIRSQFLHCKMINQPFRLYGKACYQFDLNPSNKVCGITCHTTVNGLDIIEKQHHHSDSTTEEETSENEQHH